MGYKKAGDILPPELLAQVQQYIEGASVYIPRLEQNRRRWGEETGLRDELDERNAEICRRYAEGDRVEQMAEEYHMSPQAIYKVIAKGKTE